MDVWSILIDTGKMMVFGFALGIILAKVNIWMVKRDAKKMVKDLMKYVEKDKLEEIGRMLGKAILRGVMEEFRKSPPITVKGGAMLEIKKDGNNVNWAERFLEVIEQRSEGR